MGDCNPKRTPAAEGLRLGEGLSPLLVAARVDAYRSVVGSLIYILVGTRPEIAHVVMQLCSRMAAPAGEDWTAAMHVPSFLEGSKRGLRFSAGSDDAAVLAHGCAY